MTSETKNCQACKKSFVIEPEDFSFYEKLKVPPPTWCPDCRRQRRFAFYNLTTLYKRDCDKCGKNFISVFAPEAPYVVYCPKCWWSDDWDRFSYGQDYDFSRPFFEQWNELMHKVPQCGLMVEMSALETSPYANYGGSLKNCYLTFNAEFNEDAMIGFYIYHVKSTLDSSLMVSSERMYDSMHVYKVNNGVGLRDQVTESVNVAFLRDSSNCQDCIGGANLHGKSNIFFGEQLSKEEYHKRSAELDLGSWKNYHAAKARAKKHWNALPRRALNMEMADDCTGNLIFESRNVKDSFEVANCEDCRFVTMIGRTKDSYDLTGWDGVENCYESCAIGAQAANVRFSLLSAIGASDMEYSMLTISGRGFFGCVSVLKGEYCILNKQYPKAEFEKLRERIIAHMNEMPYTDSAGRVYKYGEFFPPDMSPWAYNDTLAQRAFPLDESSAKAQGFGWRPASLHEHPVTKKAEELPDHIRDAGDDVLKESLGCMSCGRAYKIAPSELAFLREIKMPLPRECPFCRIDQKLNHWFQEFRLVDVACSDCGKGTKAPEFKAGGGTLYCQDCYNLDTR